MFKTGLSEYLVRQGKSFLGSELNDIVDNMLRTTTVTVDAEGAINITTNDSLIQLDYGELREERELPSLFIFREVNMFRTSDTELLFDKCFTLQSLDSITAIEDYVLGYSSSVIVLVDSKPVGYSVYDYADELDYEETEEEVIETTYVVWEREVYRLTGERREDEVVNEGYTSKRFLVNRIKELLNSGFRDFKAFSMLDNTQLHFKVFSLDFDTLSKYTLGSLGLVFTDEQGSRLFDRYDDGDAYLPF